MTINFLDLAKRTSEEIVKPPLLPIATYLATVEKPAEFGQTANGKWDTLEFTLKINSLADGDAEAVAAYGDITTARLRHRFLISKEDLQAAEKSLYYIKRFLEDHLKCWQPGMTMEEAIANAVNYSCLAETKWRRDESTGEDYAEIRRTAPVT